MDRICPKCGIRVVKMGEKCECELNSNRNAYQREYYQRNKELLKPLRTKRWSNKREKIIKRDQYHCQRCARKYGVLNSNQLQVHHIKSRVDFPELMYDDSNLITVCKRCNLELGTSNKLDFDWQPPEIKIKKRRLLE